jgi:hypothetical protein
MSTREKLENLLVKHIRSETSVEEVIQLAEDALKRATADRVSRVELKIKAENLEEASRAIAKALGPARDLHFFLRMAKTLATQSLDTVDGATRGLEEGREFDKKTKCIFSDLKRIQSAFLEIAEACKTLTDKKREYPVFPREGSPVDELKRQLGFELAALWHWATGKVPAASGSASCDKPGTPFGSFIALAAATSGKNDFIKSGFAGFLRRVCSDYRKSSVCAGMTAVDDNGVETPKTF